jgi:hypothetical protein
MTQDEWNQKLQGELDRREVLKRESVQKLFSRKALEQGFLECFELVGGVPRLAIWANDPANYADFLKLLVKFAPKELGERNEGKVINFLSSVPDSPLNTPRPDHERPALEADDGELVDG